MSRLLFVFCGMMWFIIVLIFGLKNGVMSFFSNFGCGR